MANTTAAVNIDRISELALDALVTEGIPLNAFTTDFTDEVEPKGETVTTRYAGSPTVVDFSTASNRDAADSTLTPIVLTLDNYRGVPLGFTDLERSYTDDDLISNFIAPTIGAIVDKIINDVLALVTDANGFALNEVAAAGAFDADVVATLAQKLSTAKVPKSPRSLIVPPTYFASLIKDNSVSAASDGPAGTDPMANHALPRLHGFSVYEYNGTIPANAESNAGLALHPQALCIAARQIAPPTPGTWAGNVSSITDPKSGLTVQVREFYDNTVQRYEFSVLYGVKTGMAGKAVRILSA